MIFLGGGGRGGGGRGWVARVSELFFRKNPNLKKNFKGVGGGWLGYVIFFTKNPNLKYNIFWGGGGRGGQG